VSKLSTSAPAILFGLGLFGLWEAYVRFAEIDPLLLPAPSAVLEFILVHFRLLAPHTLATALIIILGVLLGASGGLGIGIVLHRSEWIRRASYPWLVASQMIPIPAIAPVLLLWMGFTIWPKLLVVALISFFPVAVNTIDGLRRVEQGALDLLRTFKASPAQQLRIVSLPAALPSIFSGLRIAMALAVVAAIFGEWVGTRMGLGKLMLVYNNQARTDGLFATIALLAIVGITLFLCLGWIERKLMPWINPRSAAKRL
jgi:ABC-type nitrate/sulfonate/bicarbonate transport system permease component|tara:strand:+ start:1622 stop:2392 length:771 start_codon:yes stop_codon:yes gene_type:complete